MSVTTSKIFCNFSISLILTNEIDSGTIKIGFSIEGYFYCTYFHGKWSCLAPVQLYFSVFLGSLGTQGGLMGPWASWDPGPHGTGVPLGPIAVPRGPRGGLMGPQIGLRLRDRFAASWAPLPSPPEFQTRDRGGGGMRGG